jgi:hypothetical protein
MDRYSLKLPAWISLTDEGGQKRTLEVATSNICAGGAFFDIDSPLSVGTNINIDILLPLNQLTKLGGQESRIDISGSVIRVEPQGMAVMFDKKYQISPVKNG